MNLNPLTDWYDLRSPIRPMMRKSLVLLMLAFLSHTINAQQTDIRTMINAFFEALHKRDTALLRTYFIPAAQLYSYSYDSKGNPRAKGETLADFLRKTPILEGDIEEKLTGWQCLVDDGVASVWAPYQFYFDGKFTHCGIDNFQLMQVQDQWKITQLTDTRRKENCVDEDKERFEIDSSLNAWHHAAAVADEKAFFGFMTKDAVYIGTDPTERWKRDELQTWSKKYFEGDSAWVFTPRSRNIDFGPGGQIAWFDELLDTWMGLCRSSGVVEKNDGVWKLVHYQLAVAVPNDKMKGYTALIGKS